MKWEGEGRRDGGEKKKRKLKRGEEKGERKTEGI